MVKIQNQASQELQIPEQQQQLTNKKQNTNSKGQSQSSFKYQKEQQTKQTDYQIRSSQTYCQNRNCISFKCVFKITLIILIVLLISQFLLQIENDSIQQDKYHSNMKILDQYQKINSKLDSTLTQYQPKYQNNKPLLIKQQYSSKQQSPSNQTYQDTKPHLITTQQKESHEQDDTIHPSDIKLNKTIVRSDGTKILTFKEMYQQFLKKQQKINNNQEPDDLDHPTQLVINPAIYPFNQQFPIDQLYDQYGSFTGISPQTLSKAKKWNQLTTTNPEDPSNIQQMNYYQSRYEISKYEQLPFCIVVPTFNNAYNNRYLTNIQSIIMQNYKNYHIVLIDDASEDNTIEFIQQYLQEHRVESNRYVIIKNQVRLNAMPNLRNAAQNYCKPQEIFMIVDGDDKLIGRQVFKLFNAVFQQKKVWFVYSNFLLKNKKIGYSRPFPKSTIRKNSFRRYAFITSHLRAFYTKLFLNIQQQDLKDEDGNYFKVANDVAICLPILEQAQERIGYLPEITYHYNSDTGMNNHQLRLTEQRANQRKIRNKRSYRRLENLID